jgi:hypothetical protein
MGSYKNNWIQVLKSQQVAGWAIGEHGQAVIIKVGVDKDFEAEKAALLNLIEKLETEVQEPKEWLKFIIYNGKSWSQHIIE